MKYCSAVMFFKSCEAVERSQYVHVLFPASFS
jgi:hypothetical protein